MSRLSSCVRRPVAIAPRRVSSIAARCIAIALSMAPMARATDYFVKNGGDDNADGLSDATAWATIGKVNSRTFAPGDLIQFRRGSTWTGVTLTVPSSGSPGNPIVFGAYGSGAMPIIDCAGLESCIKAQNKSYITVQDIEVGKAGQALYSLYSHHMTIQRVTARDAIANGIIVRGGFENHVLDCTAISNGQAGIFFKGDANDHLHDSSIQRCFIDGDNGDTNDGIALHDAATSAEVLGDNFVVRDNLSINCGEQGYDITSGGNILLENNVSRGNEEGALIFGHAAHNVTVRYHRSENEPTDRVASFKVGAPDVTVEYSTFIGHPTALDPQGKPIPLVWVTSTSTTNFPEVQPNNLTMRNNVFVWNHPTVGGDFFKLNSGAYPLNIDALTIKNNIFVSRTNQGGVMRFANPAFQPNHSGFDIDNNLYYGSTATQWAIAGNTYDFAGYRGTFGKDMNGVQANPQFVDLANGDFHLSSTSSPAYNAGQNVGISTDPDGVSIPQGGARDIGAFELGAVIPAPTDLTVTSVTETAIDLSWTDHATTETAYQVFRSTTSGDYPSTAHATTGSVANPGGEPAEASFSDSIALSPDTTYFYRVRAETAEGVSGWSNEVTATTPELDLAAPVFQSLTATPDYLWPANHKMIPVTLSASVTDDRDSAPVTKILSVTSSESANGTGDGNTAVDWEITGDLTLSLRAERSGGGVGRIYTITVQSSDASGNVATAIVLVPVGHNNDTKAPAVALTAPAAGTLLGGAVGISATATDNNGVVGVQFKVDGVNFGPEDTAAPYEAAWNTALSSDGNHVLTAVARDENGNTATSAPVAVAVDNTAPAVAVTGPAAGAVLTATVALAADASDNVAVAGVEFMIDGETIGAEDTTAPFELNWDSTGTADGPHTLTAVARDTLNNVTTSAPVAVMVDNEPPTVALTAPLAGAVVGGANVVLAAEATDLAGVAGVQFRIDGVNIGSEVTDDPSNSSITWDASAVSDGPHTLTAVARDLAGHTTISAPIVVTVDNITPPGGGTPIVIDFNAYVSGATTSGDPVGSIGLAGANGNNAVRFLANAPGDWVEFTMPTTAIPAKTYSVTVRARVANSMGTYQLSIDGVNQGTSQSLYSASGGFAVLNLGTVQISGSNHHFRFTCTGKAPASSNYTLTLDTITLTP